MTIQTTLFIISHLIYIFINYNGTYEKEGNAYQCSITLDATYTQKCVKINGKSRKHSFRSDTRT